MQADTAAPIQSAPQSYQTQPTSYAAPVAQQTAAQAPMVATTPQWVAPYQPVSAPAPQMPAQMGVTPQYQPTQSYPQAYQQAPVAQPVSAPVAENPYKEAFNRVVGLLSSPVQFPFQGQQSAPSQPTVPANYSSQPATQYSNNPYQAPLTSMPGASSNQVSFSNSSPTSLEISREQLLANGVSPKSLEVIDHFGPDAARVLNEYSCSLEDHLVITNNQLVQAVGLLQELSNEHKAYEIILTDPDVLADYTTQFFGENGPYPIPDEETGYRPAPVVNTGYRPIPTAAAPQQFERPQMPVPPQPQAQGNPAAFWDSFGTLADRDPANAWRYLNAAQSNPDVFRQKLLVME
jgi:hypothetical protein